MRREGTNPDDVQPEDVLCDFCHKAAWADDSPCVEGHHGSVICGNCLTAAFAALSDGGAASPEPCTMCLEIRDEQAWHGVRPEAQICRRCVKLAAGALHKSKDWDWSKPA